MTIKQSYEHDVASRACVACDHLGEQECCPVLISCGVPHQHFSPVSFAVYEQMNGGPKAAKFDGGKPEIDLVPTQIVRDIAEVRMYGTKKYGDPDNWRKVELRRYVNALLRHTLAFMEDNTGNDAESGIPHYKHMACNLAFICQLIAEENNGK